MLKLLETRIPPPLVALLCGVLMWAAARVLPLVPLNEILRITLAVAAWLVSTVISIAGVVSFRRIGTTVNPLKPDTSSALVVSGIYRVTRNPMYVGLALLLVAWGVYLSSFWSLFGVVVFVLYINRFQIMPEERALKVLFGEAYQQYCQRVRRWL